MRIAFDLDGTLADLRDVLDQAAERLFPPGAAPSAPAPAEPDAADPAAVADPAEAADDEPVPARLEQLGPAAQRRLWRRVLETENFWETLSEIEPGQIARLALVALERHWEVIFITQRPPSAGDTCQLQSQRWLARYGFSLPSVFVIRGSRGKVATALDLDVVVDDRPENCLDVVLESKARGVLVWRGDPNAPQTANARRLNIEVVSSIAECLDQLTAEREEKPSLLGRLKRFIGS